MDTEKNTHETHTGGFRCFDCKKLLARGEDDTGGYQIKCPRCGALNSIFKGFADQIVITDPDGVIMYANSMVETITGYSLGEVLGKRPSLWGGEMSKKFYEDMWHHIKVERKPLEVVLNNKKKDGTLYKVKLHISPVFGFDNEIKMFVGIESVIT